MSKSIVQGYSPDVEAHASSLQNGRKVNKNDIDWKRIQFNKKLPELSYRLIA